MFNPLHCVVFQVWTLLTVRTATFTTLSTTGWRWFCPACSSTQATICSLWCDTLSPRSRSSIRPSTRTGSKCTSTWAECSWFSTPRSKASFSICSPSSSPSTPLSGTSSCTPQVSSQQVLLSTLYFGDFCISDTKLIVLNKNVNINLKILLKTLQTLNVYKIFKGYRLLEQFHVWR